MDWSDTPSQQAFREQVRCIVHEHFPADYTADHDGEQSLEPEDVRGYNWMADRRSPDFKRRDAAQRWAALLARRGWITPHWPREFGGAELGVIESFILHEEMMRAGVPTVNGIGAFLLGPTLLAHGTAAQCREHLPPISRGEITWAQGFSEPDAGSDLAGLRTRAVREGDEYVVNGQKTWTSLAQYADWLFALVRTDPQAPRHRGISFLLIDLRSPGITVRPIVDMRGSQPFAEVFFDNVRVPVANRVGEENRGWQVAMSTLDFERAGIGATVRYEQALARLLAFVQNPTGEFHRRPGCGDLLCHEIAQRYIETRVMRNLALYNASLQAAGETDSGAASINQLFSAELHQRLAATGARCFGPWTLLRQPDQAPMRGEFGRDCIDAIAHTLLAGSAEIQRNVIARRGLGLPRE